MANPPPPYDNITGISRTVMKDNAQETLANYNGNARPGEIVADLTTDPPALYVGNNLGALTALPSASAYGNANVVSLLATFGSNTISTTGNITGNNVIGNFQGTTGDILNVDTTNLTVTNILAPSPGNVVNIGAGGNNNLVVSNVLVQIQNVALDVVGNISAGNIGVSERITCRTVVTDPAPLGNLTVVPGARGFANDANLAAAGNFGAQVSGGAGNSVPVWSDGTNWYIG